MKKIFFFPWLFFSFHGQASIYSSDIVPVEAYTFEFNIKAVNLNPVKEDKLYEAINLLSQVMASPEFKHKIINHKFGKRFRFARNKGLSNLEIYERILSGVEELIPIENNAMDVEIALYSDYDSTVLGFTRPSTKRIWMNTKYFNRHNAAELASHLTHEWIHKLGFDHEDHRTPARKYSVPYAVGYIVRDLAKAINEKNDLERFYPW